MQDISASHRLGFPKDLVNFGDLPAHIPPGASVQFSEYYSVSMAAYAFKGHYDEQAFQGYAPRNPLYWIGAADAPPGYPFLSFAPDYLVLKADEPANQLGHSLYELEYRWKDPYWFELCVYHRSPGLLARRQLGEAGHLEPNKNLSIQADKVGIYLPNLSEKLTDISDPTQRKLSLFLRSEQTGKLNIRVITQEGQTRFFQQADLIPGNNILYTRLFSAGETIQITLLESSNIELSEIGLWAE